MLHAGNDGSAGKVGRQKLTAAISRQLTKSLVDRSSALCVIYHDATPASKFRQAWEPATVAERTDDYIRQLALAIGRTTPTTWACLAEVASLNADGRSGPTD